MVFHQGLPEQLNPKVRNLVILDDMMKSVDQSVTDLFTKGSHHRNISVIHIVQNINPRDASQINHVARQMYPNNAQYLYNKYTGMLPHLHLAICLLT